MDKTVTLNNGTEMPVVGLGLFKVTSSEMGLAVSTALDAGYRLFDTAQVYRNERHLADALAERSATTPAPFITSKLDPRNQGYSSTKEALSSSLENLRRERVDLYLIHWPGSSGLKAEDERNAENRRGSWEALEEAHREGRKVGAIGVSNFLPRHLRPLLESCSVRPAVLQSEFHPHLFQKDLLHFCRENKIAFQAYSSLGTSSPSNRLLDDSTVAAVAKKYERTPAQVLLKFALQHDALVIPKASKPHHVVENARLFDFEISAEDLEKMEALNQNSHYCWNPETVK